MEEILMMNPQLLFGLAGSIGAGLRGLFAYYQSKKENVKLEFDYTVFSDTLIQGAVAGIGFSVGLPTSYAALGITCLAGAGVDTYFNRMGIKILPVLRDLVTKNFPVKGIKKTFKRKKK